MARDVETPAFVVEELEPNARERALNVAKAFVIIRGTMRIVVLEESVHGMVGTGTYVMGDPERCENLARNAAHSRLTALLARKLVGAPRREAAE